MGEEVHIDDDEVEREDVGGEVERKEKAVAVDMESMAVHAATDDRSRLLPQLVLPDTPISVAPQVLGGAGQDQRSDGRVICCVVPQAPEEPQEEMKGYVCEEFGEEVECGE